MERETLQSFFEKKLKINYFWYSREAGYRTVKPRILAEPTIGVNKELPFDYKVHCFNGTPQFVEVIGNRNLNTHQANVAIYDFNWKRLEWTFGDYPMFEVDVEKPSVLNKLYKVASILADDFKYVRLDFYIVEDDIYFGEYTFCPCGGYNTYNDIWTYERDIEIGGLLFI